MTYRVRWEIDIFDATDAHDAARQALTIQRDHDSLATVFEVQTPNGPAMIDVLNPPVPLTHFTAREVATVLAALRYWQLTMEQQAGSQPEHQESWAWDHGVAPGGTLPLVSQEIDDLHERIDLYTDPHQAEEDV